MKQNGRPKGVRDATKRKTKVKPLHRKLEILINKMYEAGKNTREIQEETGLDAVRIKIAKEKPDLGVNHTVREIKEFNEDICGVYAFGVFTNGGRSKWYIGSSLNIKKRINNHLNDLKNKRHINKTFQELFDSPDNTIKLFLLQECEEHELFELENNFISRFCPGCLLNKWHLNKDADLKFYELAAERFNSSKYTINGECWIWNAQKRGYGCPMRVTIGTRTKFLPPHRLSYFIKTGTVPDIVRHQCENKRCVNPDHLDNGSYGDNSRDMYKSEKYIQEKKKKEKEFEKLWIEHNGNINVISNHTEYGKVRCYYYQKILRLKERYPEIAQKKMRKKKETGSRGPKKESLKDKILNGWKCVEENVDKSRTHKWECVGCGFVRLTGKSAITSQYPNCKRCRKKNRLRNYIHENAPDLLDDMATFVVYGVQKSQNFKIYKLDDSYDEPMYNKIGFYTGSDFFTHEELR